MICWCLSRSVHCIYFYLHSKIYNKDVELTGKEYTKDNIFFVTLKILLFVPCSCCWLIKSDLWKTHPQQKNAFFLWMQENHSRAFFLLHISRHHTSHSHNLAHLEIESHCSPQAVTISITDLLAESFEPLEAAMARQPHLDLSVHAWTRLVARLLKMKNICKKYLVLKGLTF